ncbi:MAG: fatty acid desaturase [Candidatus Nanopelagicales bacterium]|jgi:alkane 1-monooxygenase
MGFGTVSQSTTLQWRDRKRYLWLVAITMPTLLFLAIGMYSLTGWAAWFWIGPIFILGIVPIIDLVTGRDISNPPAEIIAELEADRYYRILTYAYLPLQYAGFAAGFYVIANWDLSTLTKIGFAISIGMIGGIGINTAHELGHKKENYERWLSKIALAQSFYGHFFIEHNRGHHVRVATPEDPASSRLGENFYRYWPRTVFGSLKSSWNLEKNRIGRRKKHPFRIGNDNINAWLMSVALWAFMLVWLGMGILPYLVIQMLIAITLLEAVNYLEHYGMLRQKVKSGDRERYERVDPSHSWNSDNIATNVLLYHLQRHSDHHAQPTRRYQALLSYKESPVLPTGYAGMILLALIPPAWNRVMDPRVHNHFDGDLSRANIAPGKREKLLTKYPVKSGANLPTDRENPSRAGEHLISAQCPGCAYTYRVEQGDPREGFAAGMPFFSIPGAWNCPDCGVCNKNDFTQLQEQQAR